MSQPPLTAIAAFKLFVVIMMGLVMHASFADKSYEDQRAHQQPSPLVPPPLPSSSSSKSFVNFSSTPTPTTTVLLQGKKKEEVGPSGSFAIPLRLAKQSSGWGMVGEILAGDDYEGLSFRVMFDPQTSSTFLFDHSIKKNLKNTKKENIFTTKNHLYNSGLSSTSAPIPGDELKDSLFDISFQDGSRYHGQMISDSMEFDILFMEKVNFGTVTYINDAAANIRGGTFDGIVGLGFGGFTRGDRATCILSSMLGAMGLERDVFSIYISPTGKSGEIRFGGTNHALRHHTFLYHNVDLRPKATRPDDEESNDSNKSHHRRAGSVTTMDSYDEEASDDRLNGIESSDDTSFDPLDGVESSDDEETRRGGSSRTSSGDGSGSTQYHDAHQNERSMMDEGEDNEISNRRFSDVSAPSPKREKTMHHHDWMWGFNGLVAIGDSVVSISTKNDKQKVGMAFSTLVPYGLVVNARNDYVSSTFHHALRSSEAEHLSVGGGHHVEEAAEILIRCEERASLPPLSFKFGNKNDKNDVFAVFDGEEYFPTVLTKDDMLKLLEVNKEGRKAGMKVKKAKWWKQWIKKMTRGGEIEKIEKAKKRDTWCSTRDFIQFRQTGDDEEEIWQLGLGFMKKYIVEYEVASGERGHRIGIALSKGKEIKLPNKRLKNIQARYNFRKKKMEYK